MSDLLTVSETAKLLDRCVDTVRSYDRSGVLPATIRVGKGQRLFDRSTVERFAAERNDNQAKRGKSHAREE